MPELPEVETMRRGLLPLVGLTVRQVVQPPCQRRPIAVEPSWSSLRRRMIGRSITGIGRVGKRVVVELSGAWRLVVEPRMTGLVSLADVPTPDHLRLIMRCADEHRQAELLYWDRRGLGIVRLLTNDEFTERYSHDRLGPDALSITVDALRDRLKTSRRAIKVALLDQRALAGVGNLYASELLHVAAISPRRRCDSLRVAEWAAIHAALVDVLEEAIRYEGSTLADGTYRNALNKAGGYQNCHRVYDRAGQPCPRCQRPVERIVQAQRATFYCPGCQRRK